VRLPLFVGRIMMMAMPCGPNRRRLLHRRAAQ
jgi:hypothetical protein